MELKVEQYEVWPALPCERDTLGGRAGHQNLVMRLLEPALDELRGRGVVLDDKGNPVSVRSVSGAWRAWLSLGAHRRDAGELARNRERESRPLALRADDGDVAAHQPCKAPRNGETKAA